MFTMTRLFFKNGRQFVFLFLAVVLVACAPSGQKNRNIMNNSKSNFEKGSYGYDVEFFAAKQIQTIELKEEKSNARILLVPGFQGRVMTSSARGDEGLSFGWINYNLIESGKVSNQFNPYGGEERLWLGPEGGPFSIYFPKGKEQIYANWVVPREIDTEPFDVESQTQGSVSFRKEFALPNASGTNMEIRVDRKVKLLTRSEAEKVFQILLDTSLNFVAYESENILTNNGKSPWTEKTGFLSIWMLAMLNPSEKGVVFIPFKEGSEDDLGKIVTDDYFGKVPADRLLVKDGVMFFKTDGKFRSKIGISPKRSLPYCGSYDPKNQVLTLLWYSAPDKPAKYVNSKWGNEDNLLGGDVINSYNDGPVEDGSFMGPFYEIESSSPAALLAPGENITHKQRIFHISGDEAKLSLMTEKLFNIPISTIKQTFK
jgi:hypothetical protein